MVNWELQENCKKISSETDLTDDLFHQSLHPKKRQLFLHHTQRAISPQKWRILDQQPTQTTVCHHVFLSSKQKLHYSNISLSPLVPATVNRNTNVLFFSLQLPFCVWRLYLKALSEFLWDAFSVRSYEVNNIVYEGVTHRMLNLVLRLSLEGKNQ